MEITILYLINPIFEGVWHGHHTLQSYPSVGLIIHFWAFKSEWLFTLYSTLIVPCILNHIWANKVTPETDMSVKVKQKL